MAVTRENIGLLHDKITVSITISDYLQNIENILRTKAKTATVAGFRKGMVPTEVMKKMYGQAMMQDDIIKLVERQLSQYLQTEKLEIFAQPLPILQDYPKLDIYNPKDYNFCFEIGLKPNITIDVSKFDVTKYNILVDDKMIDEELDRLRTRHGKMTEPETVVGDDYVLNINFVEADKDGNAIENGVTNSNSVLVKYFAEGFKNNLIGKKNNDVILLQLNKAFEDKELDFICQDLGLDKNDALSGEKYFNITITKVGFVEKADLNDEFFIAAFLGKEIKTEEDCRAAIKEEISAAYLLQSKNQIHDQLYHQLIDNTNIEYPEAFLKRWLQVNNGQPKTLEEVETSFPAFINSYKWTLISAKIALDNNVKVLPDDIKAFAKNQLFSYMGMGMPASNETWVDEYVVKMMQDKKFVEDSFYKIQTEKMFASLETQVSYKDEDISLEDFNEKLHNHQH